MTNHLILLVGAHWCRFAEGASHPRQTDELVLLLVLTGLHFGVRSLGCGNADRKQIIQVAAYTPPHKHTHLFTPRRMPETRSGATGSTTDNAAEDAPEDDTGKKLPKTLPEREPLDMWLKSSWWSGRGGSQHSTGMIPRQPRSLWRKLGGHGFDFRSIAEPRG